MNLFCSFILRGVVNLLNDHLTGQNLGYALQDSTTVTTGVSVVHFLAIGEQQVEYKVLGWYGDPVPTAQIQYGRWQYHDGLYICLEVVLDNHQVHLRLCSVI